MRHTNKLTIEMKFIKSMRLCKSNNPKDLYYRIKHKILSNITGIQIPKDLNVGGGFLIGHRGTIIINSNTIIGNNFIVSSGVVIGEDFRGKHKGVPTIGDNVVVHSNSVIVGNITIGDDVLIAPLTFVNFDVPSHSIVIGNPAKIIKREWATNGV